MVKFDVESAYRTIAVHPANRVLLGMKWRGQYYVDLALLFGLAWPLTSNMVPAAVELILVHSYNIAGIAALHR